MRQTIMFHFQAYVILLAMAFVVGNSIRLPLPFRTFHVRVENSLAGGKILNVHCKSGDNDLGLHRLRPNNHQEFAFKMNYLGTTLFWCTLTQGNRYASFEVFKPDSEFFYDKCGGGDTCAWRAQEDGIYLLRTDQNKWNIMYTWATN
ncbi:hypothetical protein Tsubulata_043139 [Turnera subulata]|uniref:S-protein homolog n=1 Tax=Turnera subulata TaxID=218843 RepID=A0A9Q0JNY7_9ROSI|nr:hypothetical protein Tsubulata_043139 [Turnera subulata]